jgi:hypothetical protein
MLTALHQQQSSYAVAFSWRHGSVSRRRDSCFISLKVVPVRLYYCGSKRLQTLIAGDHRPTTDRTRSNTAAFRDILPSSPSHGTRRQEKDEVSLARPPSVFLLRDLYTFTHPCLVINSHGTPNLSFKYKNARFLSLTSSIPSQ